MCMGGIVYPETLRSHRDRKEARSVACVYLATLRVWNTNVEQSAGVSQDRKRGFLLLISQP